MSGPPTAAGDRERERERDGPAIPQLARASSASGLRSNPKLKPRSDDSHMSMRSMNESGHAPMTSPVALMAATLRQSEVVGPVGSWSGSRADGRAGIASPSVGGSRALQVKTMSSGPRSSVTSRGGGGDVGVSHFLSEAEAAAANVDSAQLLNEWLTSYEHEDTSYNSAIIGAELKLRCVVSRAPCTETPLKRMFQRWCVGACVCRCVSGCG